MVQEALPLQSFLPQHKAAAAALGFQASIAELAALLLPKAPGLANLLVQLKLQKQLDNLSLQGLHFAEWCSGKQKLANCCLVLAAGKLQELARLELAVPMEIHR